MGTGRCPEEAGIDWGQADAGESGNKVGTRIDMDKICCIILNYNDAATAMALANEIREYPCLDSIVLVDNCSTDDSWEKLKTLWHTDKIHVLRTEENGGYGMGNQAGINYAVEYLEADYIIIANPDIHVTPRCIERVKHALDNTEDAVMASARVVDPQGKDLFSYWTLLPLWKDLLDTGLITRRLFKAMLNTPSYRLQNAGDEDSRLVDAVPGSFFMLKPGLLTPQDTEELFDSHIFLYYEEKVLGRKFQELGLKTVLVTDESYVHAHSVTIDKSLKRIVDKQRLLHQSKMYYYKEYLHAGPARMAGAGLVLDIILAEVWFLTVVCGLRW